MSDEPAKFILGDTAISAVTGHPARAALTHCENCGAQLTGRYCGQCGQPAIDYRRTFRHVIVDALDSFLNWDSKFFATIGLLIAKPWRLTNEFLAGRRARYLHPARLYLLASILFFFAVTYGAKSIHVDPSHLSDKDRAELEADLKKEDLPPKARAKIEKALKLKTPVPPPAAETRDGTKTKVQPPEPSPKVDDRESTSVVDQDGHTLLQFGPDKPSTPFEKWLESRAKEKIGEHGTNAQLFFIAVINNLPYMMLCAIPLFAFVLKILYIRKGKFYIDHLVYALHIHTFAYFSIILIVLASMGLNRIAPPLLAGWIIGLLWLAFAVQILLSIRRVYRQGWFFSIFKFFVGGFIYLIVLSMALAATFLITLALP